MLCLCHSHTDYVCRAASSSTVPVSSLVANSVTPGDAGILAAFAKHGVPWGIQYYLAAGVSMGSWSWVDLKDCSALHGQHVGAASHLIDMLHQVKDKVHNDVRLWLALITCIADPILTINVRQEYDREESALAENVGRGLGLMGEWGGSLQWHGGQIEQRADLEVTAGPRELKFRVILRPPALTYKSRALMRFLGSRHILQLNLQHELIKVHDNAHLVSLHQFLALRLVLLGRTFILFHVKENTTAWYIETVSPEDSSFACHASDHHRFTYEQVIHWVNPTEHPQNYDQVSIPVAVLLYAHLSQSSMKWTTRNVLILSITKPVLEFKPENIHFVDDICE
jgi:RNA-dependent RNA polymerase